MKENLFDFAMPLWLKNKRNTKNLQVGFRCDFVADDTKKYVLKISASTYYKGYLDGEFVAYGPARAAHGYVRADQIDLPAPIISRFDLIFVIEDKPSRKRDSELAQHILHIHQSNEINYVIEPEILRKYIAYARKNVNPVLTDEANEVLKNFYVDTRNSSSNTEENTTVPITARQLEAIIRLSEASVLFSLSSFFSIASISDWFA